MILGGVSFNYPPPSSNTKKKRKVNKPPMMNFIEYQLWLEKNVCSLRDGLKMGWDSYQKGTSFIKLKGIPESYTSRSFLVKMELQMWKNL